MCSAFYSDNIKTFLNQNEDEIFGIIAKNDEYDSVCKQKDAWIAQIRLLKNALNKYSNGSVIFEYTIPRVGGRIDNVVLLNDTLFVLEFKVGNEVYTGSAATQARTYAIDLANFHEESHNKTIVPILIATDAPKGVRIFGVPLSIILKVVFRPEHSKKLYESKLTQIPKIKDDNKNSNYYRIHLKGDINNNKTSLELKEIR